MLANSILNEIFWWFSIFGEIIANLVTNKLRKAEDGEEYFHFPITLKSKQWLLFCAERHLINFDIKENVNFKTSQSACAWLQLFCYGQHQRMLEFRFERYVLIVMLRWWSGQIFLSNSTKLRRRVRWWCSQRKPNNCTHTNSTVTQMYETFRLLNEILNNIINFSYSIQDSRRKRPAVPPLQYETPAQRHISYEYVYFT